MYACIYIITQIKKKNEKKKLKSFQEVCLHCTIKQYIWSTSYLYNFLGFVRLSCFSYQHLWFIHLKFLCYFVFCCLFIISMYFWKIFFWFFFLTDKISSWFVKENQLKTEKNRRKKDFNGYPVIKGLLTKRYPFPTEMCWKLSKFNWP